MILHSGLMILHSGNALWYFIGIAVECPGTNQVFNDIAFWYFIGIALWYFIGIALWYCILKVNCNEETGHHA